MRWLQSQDTRLSPPIMNARSPASSFPTRPRRARLAVACVVLTALAGCLPHQGKAPRHPGEVRAEIARLLPVTTADRQGWATDIHAALAVLDIDPSAENICAALAVTEQESTYTADPVVPGLASIARAEIQQRASRLGVPKFLVDAALRIKSPDGRSYSQRIAAVRTERELSQLYEEFIDSVPMGRRLFERANPVRTGGPMQVSIAFAEAFAKDRSYPYPIDGSIRNEVFTRRGGMYFGIAHLLAYPTSYDKPLYRFADFNAGLYASRNAAFQKAVSLVSGVPLALDGDLVRHRSDDNANPVGATELAVRVLGRSMAMSDSQIRRALERGHRHDFEETELYQHVFKLADDMEGKRLPRAVIPNIRLQSPKITRKLTTEWFATRVDKRYRNCIARATR